MCPRSMYLGNNGFGSALRHGGAGQAQHCPAAWLCICEEVTGLEQLQLEGNERTQCPAGTPTQTENVEREKRSQVNTHKIHKRAGNRKEPGFWSRDGFSQWVSREKGGDSAGEIPSHAPEESSFSLGRG